jgi:hypothetical protein
MLHKLKLKTAAMKKTSFSASAMAEEEQDYGANCGKCYHISKELAVWVDD